MGLLKLGKAIGNTALGTVQITKAVTKMVVTGPLDALDEGRRIDRGLREIEIATDRIARGQGQRGR